MARITIGVGGVLIILGLVAYFVLAEPDEAGAKSITAMIPAFFGVPILLLGFVATKAALRKHAMHGAVLLALLGMVGALMRPVRAMIGGEFTMSTAAGVQMVMAAICLVFVVLCVKSFIAARKSGGISQ